MIISQEAETKTDEVVKEQIYPRLFAEEDKLVDEVRSYLNKEITETKIPLSVDKAMAILSREKFVKVNLKGLEKEVLDFLMIEDNSLKGVFRKDNILVEVYDEVHWTRITNTTNNFAKLRFRNIEGTYLRDQCFCGIENNGSYNLERED
jgi:hypothetical protein